MDTECRDCPRDCRVKRPSASGNDGVPGFCGCGLRPMLARAGLHFWEEPCISGEHGSGTVFFSSCTLRCVYCQNYGISSGRQGQEISVERLRQIYQELIQQGAHNINLVTPSHFTEAVLESLREPLSVPVVYNTNGYDKVETLQRLSGKVQIYLPDLKYADNRLGERYSSAKHYFETACAAIEEMYRQRGPYRIGEDGMMQSGVIVRHLILPNCVDNTKRVIDWVAGKFKPGEVMFSLMRQYVPCGRAEEYPELNRRITEEEYEEAEQYLFDSGIEDGFVQEEESASKDFIPAFDGSGVLEKGSGNPGAKEC